MLEVRYSTRIQMVFVGVKAATSIFCPETGLRMIRQLRPRLPDCKGLRTPDVIPIKAYYFVSIHKPDVSLHGPRG